MDEKVLFLVKTPHKCEVKFSVMSLEEPEEANAEGLKLALENSILKLGLNIERKNREVFLFHFYIMKSVKRNIYIFFSNGVFSYLSIYFFHFNQELLKILISTY